MKALAALIILIAVASPASALSFLEDFEDESFGQNPSESWYTFSESDDDTAIVSPNSISGNRSLLVQGPTNGNLQAAFTLTGPTQLTNVSFSVKGMTPSEGGSRQFIQIQSQAPHRTLAEFYVFCTNSTAPDACEFRVRFETIDSKGQVLINTSLGQDTFNVTVIPDWTDGTYQLFVNGVDDGVFPFLQLPSNIGRLRIIQDSSAFPLNATFDDLFIDGAVEPAASPGRDAGQFIKDFATDIQFTTPTSLFIFGLWLFAVLVGFLVAALVAVGRDNTILPVIAFVAALVTLWLVQMEFWPDWIGIALIIIVAALVSLSIRQFLIGIRDASTNAGVVAGALGYFIIATTLLGFSGYATETVELPTSSLDTPEDEEAQQNESADRQTFIGGVAECLITFFSDCTRDTVSETWATITNIASTIFNFARTAFRFLFQLLTFQLPIPVIFNALIVFPPAAALATVGFSYIRGNGS